MTLIHSATIAPELSMTLSVPFNPIICKFQVGRDREKKSKVKPLCDGLAAQAEVSGN